MGAKTLLFFRYFRGVSHVTGTLPGFSGGQESCRSVEKGNYEPTTWQKEAEKAHKKLQL